MDPCPFFPLLTHDRAIDAVPFRPALAEAVTLKRFQPGPSAAPTPEPNAGLPPQPGSSKKRQRSASLEAAASAQLPSQAGAESEGRGTEPAGADDAGGGSGKGKQRARRSSARRSSASGCEEQRKVDGGSSQGADACVEGANSAADVEQRPALRRRGDEELERELEMAMAATAAAAAAAAAHRARAGSDAAGPSAAGGLPPVPGGRGGGSLGQVAAKQQEEWRRSGSGGGNGRAWSSGGARAPRCWAEVYCGSSATGRWVPVDCVANWWDRPDTVDKETARQQPLSYVVAVQGGAPKDVTRRYAANYMATLKHRDEGWWGATMRAVRLPSAHLPPRLRAEVEEAAALAGSAAGGDGGSAETAAGGRDGGGGGGLGGGGKGSEGSAAVLRSKREDAELEHREAVHKQGVPRTIEGFKGHALYVLKRHIGKYQVSGGGWKGRGSWGGGHEVMGDWAGVIAESNSRQGDCKCSSQTPHNSFALPGFISCVWGGSCTPCKAVYGKESHCACSQAYAPTTTACSSPLHARWPLPWLPTSERISCPPVHTHAHTSQSLGPASNTPWGARTMRNPFFWAQTSDAELLYCMSPLPCIAPFSTSCSSPQHLSSLSPPNTHTRTPPSPLPLVQSRLGCITRSLTTRAQTFLSCTPRSAGAGSTGAPCRRGSWGTQPRWSRGGRCQAARRRRIWMTWRR